MQPYPGQEPAAPPPEPAEQAPPQDNPWEDRANLLLILAGWVALLLVLPPQHDYPIIDDWNHAESVRTMLNTGQFVLPPTMQANLIGLTWWGTLWCTFFGFSFTTLTYSTLVLALAGLFAFYGIAREVNVPPWGALLGTGLLAFNPIFVHLSYSFMTDVPFLALTLLGTYFYLRGLRRGPGSAGRALGFVWLVVGGLFVGWAFLIRQFGVLVPGAFLVYLGFEGLLGRKREEESGERDLNLEPRARKARWLGRWRWGEMAIIALVPLLVVAAWYVWWRAPTTFGAEAAAERAGRFVMKEPWLRVILIRALMLLPIAALSACAAIKMRRSRLWLVPAWAVIVVAGLFTLDLPEESWVEIYEPVFTTRLGPLAVDLPQETFTFGAIGNIIRITGIDFFEYNHELLWTREVWRAIWIVGLGLGVLLLAKMTDALIDWVRARKERLPVSRVAAPYLLGLVTFLTSVALLGQIYDRYLVIFLPFLILFVVRGSARWGKGAWAYSVAALAVITSFALLAKADQIEQDNTRWQAAQWLYERSGGLHGGYDWDNWVGNRNDAYHISDWHVEGFRTERSFPYLSRLSGLKTRYVLAESREDMPPLRP